MANNTNGTSLPSSGNYSCSEIAKTTLWPGAPCSGRGKCTPTGCVCPPDWSGNSDFFTSAGYDCQIHDIATTVLNSFTAVVSTFNLIYGFYLLWHHFASAPSSDLRGRSTKGINRAKKREKARFNKVRKILSGGRKEYKGVTTEYKVNGKLMTLISHPLSLLLSGLRQLAFVLRHLSPQ